MMRQLFLIMCAGMCLQMQAQDEIVSTAMVITTKTSEKQLIKNRIKTFGNRLYPNSPQYYITDLSTADVVFDNDGALINGVYVNNKAHVYQPLELE